MFPQASVALKAVFDMNEFPKDPTDDLLRFVQAEERFVASVKPLVEAAGTWYRKAAPVLRNVVQVITQLENAPPVKGYEPLLVSDGYEPLEAKFFAAAMLHTGQQSRRERLAERRLAGAMAALAKAHGRGTLAVAHSAKKLEQALEDPAVEASFSKAWSLAGVPEPTGQFDDLVTKAINRDVAACQRLTEIARALRPNLCDPRGRTPSLESVTHEALLALRGKGAYTYDDLSGDMTDASTQATRTAMDAPDFDPRPAHRRNKHRQAQQRR